MAEKTDNDHIIGFLLGKCEKLSKPQEKKLERLMDCDRLMKLYPRQSDVVQMLASKYKLIYGEDGYSLRTAINDFQSTQLVFGAMVRLDRSYHVGLLLAEIAETRQIARASGNATAMAKCDQNKLAAIEKFMGDKDTPDYSSLQVPEQSYSADWKVLGLEAPIDDAKFMAELERLKAPKAGRRRRPDAEDAEFEIVGDE